MKILAATMLAMGFAAPAAAQTERTEEGVASVAPALQKYTQQTLLDGVWKRPALSPRDRSVVTLSTLIARSQTIEMRFHFERALDNGVTPAELSEIITHLAFYSGWGNATAAAAELKTVFANRGVGPDQLPAADSKLLPLDDEAEAKRVAAVKQNVGPVAPHLEQDTTDVLFRDLWLRPDLKPRDRSLVTVSALVASGQFAQITYHLNRAMDAGLTRAEASELVSHIAYYAGWPNAFSAVPVFKAVFESRGG